MTVRVLLHCNRRRGGEECRGWSTFDADPHTIAATPLVDVDAVRAAAFDQGWSQTDAGADVCPSCTRALAGDPAARALVEPRAAAPAELLADDRAHDAAGELLAPYRRGGA